MIGAENESSMHRGLKETYASDGWQTEAAFGGYVCDCLNDAEDEVVEIQTGSFAPLKKKVASLVKNCRVTIVHPIITEKTIELYDVDGNFLRRRKSPRKGNKWDLFKALIYAPMMPLLPKCSIELALIEVLEKRIDDGKGSWRRKGISIDDKEIIKLGERVPLVTRRDYIQFAPFAKKEIWTTRDLAAKTGIALALAQKTVYVLNHIGLIKNTGKCGRLKLWKRV